MVVLVAAIRQGSKDYHTMSGKGNHWRAASATPWDGMPAGELTPAQAIVAASHRSMYEFRHHPYTGDAAFFNGYPRSECPHCGGRLTRSGHDRSGLQRYRCSSCGRTSTSVTGTIFEDAKLPIPAWVDFLLQAFSYASVGLMTREGRRSDTTLPYWMAKLFSVLEGIQDGVVLDGDVWLDETHVPKVASELWRRPDGKLPRGLSRNRICIGVAVDGHGRSIYILEGVGQVTAARTLEAFEGHMAEGSHLIHDMEPAHKRLVERLGLRSETHNGKLIMGMPDDENPLDPVNEAHFLLKSFLRAHSGYSRRDLQGYLDLFHVIMNEPTDRMEKAAMVLDRAMSNPKTLRYRDFYGIKPRSDERDDR